MTRLRSLSPAVAWNEAERRAIPVGIVGFFVSGLAVVFAAPAAPADQVPAFWAFFGAAAGFFVSLSLSLAYYRRRWIPYALYAMGSTAVLCGTGYAELRLAGHGVGFTQLLALVVFPSVLLYIGLHWLHIRMCSGESAEYLRDLVEDESAFPKTRLVKIFYWISAAIGGLLLLAFLQVR